LINLTQQWSEDGVESSAVEDNDAQITDQQVKLFDLKEG